MLICIPDWLAAVAGYEHAELEVVQRTMRIKNQGEPVNEPMRSILEVWTRTNTVGI